MLLTRLISYNICDIKDSEKQMSRINHLPSDFQGDFCDTPDGWRNAVMGSSADDGRATIKAKIRRRRRGG